MQDVVVLQDNKLYKPIIGKIGCSISHKGSDDVNERAREKDGLFFFLFSNQIDSVNYSLLLLDARFAQTFTLLKCLNSRPARSIIKRVTAMEYKLHRLIVKKEDFIAYVQVKYTSKVKGDVKLFNV